MTLTTHAVVGAGLAVIAKANPLTAFVLGFFSHFLLDAIPHWDYPLASGTKPDDPMEVDMVFGKAFFFDLLCIGIDFALGLYLALLFISTHHVSFAVTIASSIFWGALGAMIPDFLQFLYFKIRKEPFTSLQKFHIYMHADYRFPHRSIVGPLIQLLIVAGILVFAFVR